MKPGFVKRSLYDDVVRYWVSSLNQDVAQLQQALVQSSGTLYHEHSVFVHLCGLNETIERLYKASQTLQERLVSDPSLATSVAALCQALCILLFTATSAETFKQVMFRSGLLNKVSPREHADSRHEQWSHVVASCCIHAILSPSSRWPYQLLLSSLLPCMHVDHAKPYTSSGPALVAGCKKLPGLEFAPHCTDVSQVWGSIGTVHGLVAESRCQNTWVGLYAVACINVYTAARANSSSSWVSAVLTIPP